VDPGTGSDSGLAGVWAGPVLVGSSDAFAWLVCFVRPLSSGVANTILAVVPNDHTTPLLCDYYSDNRACLHAYAHAHVGAYRYCNAYSYSDARPGAKLAFGYCFGAVAGLDKSCQLWGLLGKLLLFGSQGCRGVWSVLDQCPGWQGGVV
jgi:hypothetical protein